MREILFKAKRESTGEWVEGFYAKRHGVPYIYENADCPQSIYEINPDTLCQYTGLTDKNGRKIWENDILREYADTDDLGNDLYYFYQVFWDKINSEYGVKNDVESMGLSCVSTKWAEVIGNVFDNPELLEKAR